MRKKRKASNAPRFVQLYHWEMETPAYQNLSCYGRALIMEFRRLYNGHNNGEIYMSVRQAARLLNCHKDTAAKYLAEVEAKGWIRQTSRGRFSQKTDKTASTWRITNQPIGLGVDTPETKEYAKWKPGAEIQNAVPPDRTTCPTRSDRGQKNGPTKPDRTPLICPTTSDHHPQKTPLNGPTKPDTYISSHRGDAEGPSGQPAASSPVEGCHKVLVERLGADGWLILTKLPSVVVDDLAQRQTDGTLTNEYLQEKIGELAA